MERKWLAGTQMRKARGWGGFTLICLGLLLTPRFFGTPEDGIAPHWIPSGNRIASRKVFRLVSFNVWNKSYQGASSVDVSFFCGTLIWEEAADQVTTDVSETLLSQVLGTFCIPLEVQGASLVQETTFIEQLVADESQMEGRPPGCSKVMVWHLHLEAPPGFPYPAGWTLTSPLPVNLPLHQEEAQTQEQG